MAKRKKAKKSAAGCKIKVKKTRRGLAIKVAPGCKKSRLTEAEVERVLLRFFRHPGRHR